MNEQTLAKRDPFALPDRATAETKFRAIAEFQKLVHAQMVPDIDYGVIPGTQKPTLLKPGAEKIAKLLGLADQYEIVDKVEDWDKGFFAYTIRCILVDMASQVVVSSGLGSCNSKESRYRWREQKRKCPRCGAEAIFKSKQAKGGWYCFGKVGGCGANFVDGDQAIETQKTGRVENEDIFSQVNTILKISKKRSLVDASLSAGRLSNLFTQDMEDLAPAARVDAESASTEAPEDWDVEAAEPAPVQPPAKSAAPAPKPTPQAPSNTPPVRDEQSIRAKAIATALGWDSLRFAAEFEKRAATTWREASPLTKAAVMDEIERTAPAPAEKPS